jgi:putative hydrolase of the HAD superfamily
MYYKAVIFDLFGTLVRDFTRQEYDQVNAKMAKNVGIPYHEFWQLVAETGQGWYSGYYSSVEARLKDICRRWGVESDDTQVTQAAKYHYEFITNAIVPEQEVMEVLNILKSRGLRLGLITNCGPAVPLLWEQSSLARLIDVPVFSSRECVKKPDIRVYQVTCHQLQAHPRECIYVGDGSSDELKGATAIGMLPILKRTDLNDVYDAHRPEVEGWQGLAINEINELPDLLLKLEGVIKGR